jgi:hypothetical protein
MALAQFKTLPYVVVEGPIRVGKSILAKGARGKLRRPARFRLRRQSLPRRLLRREARSGLSRSDVFSLRAAPAAHRSSPHAGALNQGAGSGHLPSDQARGPAQARLDGRPCRNPNFPRSTSKPSPAPTSISFFAIREQISWLWIPLKSISSNAIRTCRSCSVASVSPSKEPNTPAPRPNLASRPISEKFWSTVPRMVGLLHPC